VERTQPEIQKKEKIETVIKSQETFFPFDHGWLHLRNPARTVQPLFIHHCEADNAPGTAFPDASSGGAPEGVTHDRPCSFREQENFEAAFLILSQVHSSCYNARKSEANVTRLAEIC
jgi:hypothetical protein